MYGMLSFTDQLFLVPDMWLCDGLMVYKWVMLDSQYLLCFEFSELAGQLIFNTQNFLYTGPVHNAITNI